MFADVAHCPEEFDGSPFVPAVEPCSGLSAGELGDPFFVVGSLTWLFVLISESEILKPFPNLMGRGSEMFSDFSH